MGSLLKVAAIQLRSGAGIEENLEQAETFIRQAAGEGATLIVTPEVTDQVISNRAEKIDQAFTQDRHPGVAFFSALAKELSIDLIIGSMCIKTSDDKIANRSFHFGPDGEIKALYDKIHLYDVDLPTGESHRESKIFKGGHKAVLTQTQGAKIGLSICYDLRFPHLYRDLAKQGAQILTIPAAFTVPTGQAHWETLLRARAIECGAFVIASAQGGDHEGVRTTYGHSMIIGPWGQVLAHKDDDASGYIIKEINLDDAVKARQAIPALQHDKDYGF